MRRPLLLVHLLGAFPVLKFIAVGLPQDNDSDHPGMHQVYNKFAAVKNIYKREVVCQKWEYSSGGRCCKLCEPGSVKDQDCTGSMNDTVCKACTEGEDYMDHPNYLSRCLRCGLCDAEHGLEVEKPCNKKQNIICRCKNGFFCNSSEPCLHCDACKKCEDGIILEECTSTKDTTCGSKRRKRWMPEEQHKFDNDPKKRLTEVEPRTYEDIDLSLYISEIADEMTLDQVKMFVRKCGLSNPTMEKIQKDNEHHAAEEKINLLDTWYQEHGIRGACTTLISTLRQLKQRTLADKIEEKITSCSQNNGRADQNAEISEE